MIFRRKCAMIIRVNGPSSNTTDVLMSGTAGGHTYAAAPDCILKDGQPYIYRMGEIHYSRVPDTDWERELIKMKEGGIDVIAGYVFWNHHEHEEGSFDFSGNRNIRRFIDTCEKLDLPFFLRIGPWAHGEARQGGFPDWLVDKGCALRTNDKEYLFYVRRFFEAIYAELRGSENIIGIQVENEKPHEPEYLETLREMLVDIGFCAPLWSATAWGKAELPNSLLPMFGGYPEAPWDDSTDKLPPNTNYFFSQIREDSVIGADMLGHSSGKVIKEKYLGKYPYLTCELGGGNQPTFQRRPLFSAADIASLAICKLGSGAVGLGYYMYHGGVNPVSRDADGKLITYQESRESGYANDYAIVSYDFKALLGDTGHIRESYYALKEINEFVAATEKILSPMRAYMPENIIDDIYDTDTARISVRSDGKSGFIFYNNHVHGGTLGQKHEELTIVLNDGELKVPVYLPESGYGIIPFNLKLGNVIVRYVTALPIFYSDKRVEFVPLRGVKPEICLSNGEICPLGEVTELGGVHIVLLENEKPAPDKFVPLTVEKSANVLPFEAFEHIIRRDKTRLSDKTEEYEISIPQGVETLCLQVAGNVAAAYEMKDTPRLISDYYCDGDNWYVDVRGVGTDRTDAVNKVRKIRIKVEPLIAEDRGNIYFETEMPEGVTDVKAVALE